MVITIEELAGAMPDVSRLESCEPPMETPRHYNQLALLMSCFQWLWQGRDDIFLGANLTVYFSEEQIKNRDFRGPDLFIVKDVEPRERSSWVVWHEGGRYPDFILELLSDSTQNVDRGTKKQLYQNQFRTPEYVWFSPETLEFAGFRLIAGQYEAIAPDDARSEPLRERGWLWSEVLELYLGILDGQLRLFFADGELVPTPTEIAQREVQRANLEQQRADREQQRADRLAARLQALGIDPEDL